LLDAVSRQAGGPLFSDDGREAFLTSEPVLRAVQMFADLVQTSQITDPALSGTTAGADRDLFLNGVTAMMLTGGSWFRGSLNASDVGENAVPAPYPRFEGGPDVSGDLYGYGLAVLAQSQHPAEAWRFVAFLGSHGMDYFENGGLFIGDLATAESDLAAENPDWSVFQEQLALGHYHPRLVNYNEIADIVGRAFDAVVRAGEDPQAEFESAQSRVSGLLNT
jgi:ABC-type glycerol-3-phosphate transport system substrate-binding protein